MWATPPPQITLGRTTREQSIDVDLSLEGPAWKISRRQGVIKLRNNGDFFIANEGKRPITVDGKPVLAGNKQKLFDNSVVEVGISWTAWLLRCGFCWTTWLLRCGFVGQLSC